MWEMCPIILGGYDYKKPPNGGPKGGAIESCFSPILVKTIIFFCVCWKSILRYVKDVSLTEPTLMGGQKGMGERCRVTVL